jgi:hypothetical protein
MDNLKLSRNASAVLFSASMALQATQPVSAVCFTQAEACGGEDEGSCYDDCESRSSGQCWGDCAQQCGGDWTGWYGIVGSCESSPYQAEYVCECS